MPAVKRPCSGKEARGDWVAADVSRSSVPIAEMRWKLVRMDGIGHVGGMDTRETPPALIIVAGPQASGKTPLRKASNASA